MFPDRESARSSSDKDLQNSSISRRIFLGRGAYVLGAAAIVTGAALTAQTAAAGPGKVSQAQAGYKATTKSASRCDACAHFEAPSACKIVDGSVSPSGSCNFFAPRPK